MQGLKDSGEDDGDQVDLSVPAVNYGVPLIVVATKCDRASYLEKQLDFRSDQFDFIQYTLRYGLLLYSTSLMANLGRFRKFALDHGAALVYTGKVCMRCDVHIVVVMR